MFPVLVKLGPITVSTYGALVAAGYLIGILWLKSQIRWMPNMDLERFWALIYILFFGAIMGGKLLFVAVEWREFASGSLHFFRDFRFGFVFFGGLLGSMIMGVLAVWWFKWPYLALADFFGVALSMGHALGRFGCLGAGCCYGRPTDLPWAVRLGGHPASTTPHELWGVPLHPTQVYESLGVFCIFIFLWRTVLPRIKRGELRPGTAFLSYFFLYSVVRVFVEFFRGDDRGGLALGLFVSQWISMGGIAISGALMWRRGIWVKR